MVSEKGLNFEDVIESGICLGHYESDDINCTKRCFVKVGCRKETIRLSRVDSMIESITNEFGKPELLSKNMNGVDYDIYCFYINEERVLGIVVSMNKSNVKIRYDRSKETKIVHPEDLGSSLTKGIISYMRKIAKST